MPANLTLSGFIKRASEIHNGKYDYSNITEYTSNRVKMPITCDNHGVFLQNAFTHLRGSGCFQCGKEKRSLSHDDFINHCIKTHNNYYSYEQTQYVKQSEKITIKCPVHGNFVQKALSHYQGHGCAKCGNISRIKKTSTEHENFINACNLVHDSKYDYSKTEYISSRSMITITCPEHGDFEQKAGAHVSGAACGECGHARRSMKLKTPTPELINELKTISEHKYDYSLLTKDSYHKNESVYIKCEMHGIFKQKISFHLEGSGCTQCGIDSRVRAVATPHDTFIEQCNKIHGGFYNYSKTEYISSRSMITITCPEHGDFEQKAGAHVSGAGCGKCCGGEAKCISRDIDPYFDEFESEKAFEDLTHKGKLRYDRYIPFINTVLEYDGKQHFNEKCSWYSEEGRKRDKIKTEYAINNGYNFIRIAYYENHVEVLEEFLKLVLANPDKQIVQIYGAVQILDKK